MTQRPDWLPEMFVVSPWTVNTYNMLYKIFRQDFIISSPNYRGYAVWFFPEKEDGKEVIFWHLTSRKNKETGGRLPDLRRSECLPWVRPMIGNPTKLEIIDWDYLEGDGDIHTYIWLKNYDFLVIMKKYKDESRRLITSYHIDYPHKAKKLMKKFIRRIVF
jgi:hypothetical protein